jgi:hypothetical protein
VLSVSGLQAGQERHVYIAAQMGATVVARGQLCKEDRLSGARKGVARWQQLDQAWWSGS